ncbi:MAG: FkbM family methyltransferase [Bdellovibrionales bacterium]
MNRMLDWVDELSRNGQRFTFLDIGANIGRYAVAVENRAGQSVEIHAFEPDLTNFVLLKKNIKGITSRLHPIGLSDAPGEANLRVNALRPWDQGLGDALGTTVTLDTLDHCLAGNSKISLENLLIKMDVDGHELSVLAGAREVLKSSANVRLLIEDVCDRNAIYQKLEEIGFRPLCKLTPYNSWWEKGGPRAIPIDQSAKQR